MKSIIITGANSGIGFECAMHMAKIAPNEQILLACRNVRQGNLAIQKIKKETNHQHLICLKLDLASLESVKNFKSNFLKLQNSAITALINNAGIAPNIKDTAYTKDSFEITFGTNHLGGFYLTLLLLPYIEKDGSITFTASDTHDPNAKTGVEPPNYTSTKELAFPKVKNEKAGMKLGQRRYSTSKLCNVMTAYILHNKLIDENIRVNAFDPGLTPGTGFTKNFPAPLHFVVSRIMPLFIRFKKNMNSPKTSGTRLANLTFANEFQNLDGIYFSDGEVIKSSTDSYNKSYQLDLWKSSIELTGIKQEETIIPLT
ncbi:MAG: SDR family NAD(P)-dependent oxidoreductase [Flavobacteriaceae bacterium]|nr:SDR family NAD(P)-dependent oxidoreductase [Flavobacteriaceae bacterium]